MHFYLLPSDPGSKPAADKNRQAVSSRLWPFLCFPAASAAILGFCLLVLLLGSPLETSGRLWNPVACGFWIGLFLMGDGVLFLLGKALAKHPRLYRRLLAVLGAAILLWNLGFAGLQLKEDYARIGPYRINGEETGLTRIHALEQAYGAMQLAGSAEALSREPSWWQGALLWRWQNDAVLPMLALHYGSWILLLYWCSLLGWIAAAAAGGKQLRGGRQLLYISCVLPLLLALAGPGLDSLGFVHYMTGHPFLLSSSPSHMLPCLLRLGLMGWLLWDAQSAPARETASLRKKLSQCLQILLEEQKVPGTSCPGKMPQLPQTASPHPRSE